jgi:hypothetical protein
MVTHVLNGVYFIEISQENGEKQELPKIISKCFSRLALFLTVSFCGAQ